MSTSGTVSLLGSRICGNAANASRLASRLRCVPRKSFERGFHATSVVSQTGGPVATSAVAVRKPVGAFRGGILGFLLGSTLAGASLYYYVIDEYKVSNQLLTEDIYAMQSAVQRIETYVKTLEERAGVTRK
ncbi:hypothetical protein K461DRAFT_292241 [Myriangium duriaei CBS 260.36]|uniref:Uncharacterized protein n=1 Tax=Myriangium duriaei CBS 260.36 TaxID=1168546 RepID=A0A9P4JAN2_9PEZI|nr:hypothetical protein K461DRAFT_292241 [Myriangium duriaei CBS 260.36]